MIDTDMAIAIIRDYAENGTKHPHYDHMVGRAAWSRMMFAGVGQEVMVEDLRPHETKAQKAYRVKVSYPETPEVLEGVQTKCERIFAVDGISERIWHENSTYTEDITKATSKFSTMGDVTDYLKDRQLYYEFVDANAWMVVERRDRRDANGTVLEVQTYPLEVLSSQAINYQMGPNEPDWLLVRHEHQERSTPLETLYIYAAGLTVKARQLGKDSRAREGEQTLTFGKKTYAFSFYKNATTSFPGIKFGSFNDNEVNDMSVKAPIYSSARFALKRIVKNASLAAVQIMQHVYQKMIAYDKPCDYQDEGGTSGCGHGDGIDPSCPSCGGTGSSYHKSELDVIKISLPYQEGDNARDTFKLADLIYYVQTPLEPTQMILDRLDRDKASIPFFVFNSSTDLSTGSTTATEQNINWESAGNRVRPLAVHNEKMHSVCYNSTAQHLEYGDGFEYEYKFPKKLNLQTEVEIMDRFGKAKELGMAPEITEGIEAELLAKRYGGNSTMVKNATALREFYPFGTDEQAAGAIAMRSPEDFDLILYQNWRTVSREVRNVHQDFYTRDYSDKKDILSGIVDSIKDDLELIEADVSPFDLGSLSPVALGDQVDDDPTADPVPTPAAAPEPETFTLLNGAQVSSLVGLVESVAKGDLPAQSAIEIMKNAYGFDSAKANGILAGAGTSFKIETPSPVARF